MANPSSTTIATVLRATAAGQVSPKVNFAALGAALATIFWAIAAATWWKHTFSAATLAALTGATATIVSFGLGYLTADPLRQDGGSNLTAGANGGQRAVTGAATDQNPVAGRL